MRRSCMVRTVLFVVFLLLVGATGYAAMRSGWSFDMPGIVNDVPTAAPVIVSNPEPPPMQLPPFFRGDPAEVPPASASPVVSASPVATPIAVQGESTTVSPPSAGEGSSGLL